MKKAPMNSRVDLKISACLDAIHRLQENRLESIPIKEYQIDQMNHARKNLEEAAAALDAEHAVVDDAHNQPVPRETRT